MNSQNLNTDQKLDLILKHLDSLEEKVEAIKQSLNDVIEYFEQGNQRFRKRLDLIEQRIGL